MHSYQALHKLYQIEWLTIFKILGCVYLSYIIEPKFHQVEHNSRDQIIHMFLFQHCFILRCTLELPVSCRTMLSDLESRLKERLSLQTSHLWLYLILKNYAKVLSFLVSTSYINLFDQWSTSCMLPYLKRDLQ